MLRVYQLFDFGDVSIDHANFLRKCFEFSKKDHEISLKIRENKGKNRSHYFCTVLYM